jgi:hypothetical protein
MRGTDVERKSRETEIIRGGSISEKESQKKDMKEKQRKM